ncbi:MAG: hypothetical protein AB8B72_01900 [Crocinitomicaceae bacterium]
MFLKSIIFIFIFTFWNIGLCQYDVSASESDSISGQKKDKIIAAIKKNTYVGSGANLLVGNQIAVYLSPQIGYEFLPNFSAGFLSSIQYNQLFNFKQTALGVGVFSRYILFQRLILETSLNFYRIRSSFSGQITPFEEKSKSWLAGIGYARQLGNKAYANFSISYDLLRNESNPELAIIDLPNLKIYYKFGITIYPFRK